MQIDWLTVAAQIVNFLALVWLLQRFLYRPITQAMQRREARIEQRLSEARAARAEAEEDARALQDQKDALDASKEQILDDARQHAASLRETLENDLRAEIQQKRTAWHDHLLQEREEFARALRKEAGHRVVEITRRILADYAQSDLSNRIAGTFLRRLHDLDGETRDTLIRAARHAHAPARIETGLALDPSAKARVTRALHQILSARIDIEYGVAADILMGVRMTIAEQTIDWSAETYLRRLDTTLDEVLETSAHTPDRAAPQDREHEPV